MLQPSLHKPIPMNSRVVVPAHYLGKGVSGRVVGISSMHVIFIYIVLLDVPIDSEYGRMEAISVSGSELNGEDGKHWRLE